MSMVIFRSYVKLPEGKWMHKKTYQKTMATSAETPQDHGVPQDRKGGNILTARDGGEPRVPSGVFKKSCFPSLNNAGG